MARILVLEDEEGLRKLVQLVVADLGLPGRSGLETIVDMRTLEPNLPIIVISGRGEEELIDLITGAGLMSSVRMVIKPFEVEELVAAVRQTLGSPPTNEQSSD